MQGAGTVGSAGQRVVTISPTNGYTHKRGSSSDSTASLTAHPHRPFASPVSPGRVAAIVAPTPRLSARARSPPTPGAARCKGTGRARELRFEDEEDDVELLANGEASSVRRVLRENEASRREREEWSDSSAGGGLGGWAGRRRPRKVGDGVPRPRKSGGHKRSGSTSRLGGCLSSGGESDAQPEAWHLVASDPPHHSPPVPHSFAPFHGLARKLSRGRAHERSGSTMQSLLGIGPGFGGLTGSRSATNLREQARPRRARQRSASVSEGVEHSASSGSGAQRYVGDRPIRHLVRSPSLDSLLRREERAAAPRVPSQHGEALFPADPSVPLPAPARAVDRRQNAFVTLPPSLHHLLRAPSPTFVPQRRPPPVPFGAPFGSVLGAGARRLVSSDSQSSHLVIAIGSRLSREADERDRMILGRPQIADGQSAARPTLAVTKVGDGAGDWRERRAAALEGQNGGAAGSQPRIGRRTSSLGLRIGEAGQGLSPGGTASGGAGSGQQSVAWSSVGDLSAANVVRSAAAMATAAQGPVTYGSYRTSPAPDADQTEPLALRHKASIEPVQGANATATGSKGHHRRGSSLSTATPLSPAAAAINDARLVRAPSAASAAAPIAGTAALPRDDTFGPGQGMGQAGVRPEGLAARPAFSPQASQKSGSSGGGQVVDLGGPESPNFASLFFQPPAQLRRASLGRRASPPPAGSDGVDPRLSRSTYASETEDATAHASPFEEAGLRIGNVSGVGAVRMQRGPSTSSQQAEVQFGSHQHGQQLAAEQDATFGPRRSCGGVEELTQDSLDELFAQHGYDVQAPQEELQEAVAEEGKEGSGGSSEEQEVSPASVQVARFEALEARAPATLSVYSSGSMEGAGVQRRPSLRPLAPTSGVGADEVESSFVTSSFVSEYYSAEDTPTGSRGQSFSFEVPPVPVTSVHVEGREPATAPATTQAWSFLDVDGGEQEIRFAMPALGGATGEGARSAPAGALGFAVTGEAPVRLGGAGGASPVGSFLDWEEDSGEEGGEADRPMTAEASSGESTSQPPGPGNRPASHSPLTPPPVLLSPAPDDPKFPTSSPASHSPQTIPPSPALRSSFFDGSDDEGSGRLSPFPQGRRPSGTSLLSVDASLVGGRRLVFPGPPRSPKSPRRAAGGPGGVRNRASGLSVASTARSGGSAGLEGLDEFPRPPQGEREEGEGEGDDGTVTVTVTSGRGKLARRGSSASLTTRILSAVAPTPSSSSDGSSEREELAGAFSSGRIPFPRTSPPARARHAPEQPAASGRTRYPPRHDSLQGGRRAHRVQPSAGSFLDFNDDGEGQGRVAGGGVKERASVGSFRTFFSSGDEESGREGRAGVGRAR